MEEKPRLSKVDIIALKIFAIIIFVLLYYLFI